MRLLPIAHLALAALALPACSGQPVPQAVDTLAEAEIPPASGLEVIPLTVVTPAGKRHIFQVEVAQSEEEQARGLMFRERLGANQGMLFPRNPPDRASFWMKNTVIPLDIIFIGTDRRVINIAADAVPHSLDPRNSAGLAAAVLELNGGRAAELGIVPGSKVEW